MRIQSLWVLPIVAAIFGLCVMQASADDSDAIPRQGPELSLDEAVQRALSDQPILDARQAQINAEDAQAVSLRQLPDPKLIGGFRNLAIEHGEPFSLRNEDFTEVTVGLRQDFPRAAKRRLKGERRQSDADADRSALDNDRRRLRRDVSLAWLDVHEAEQALALNRSLATEAALQVQALAADYGNGKAAQADWLAAKVEAGLADDKAHEALLQVLRLRARLARWIGVAAANRPLADTPALPALTEPLPALLEAADRHPVVGRLDQQIKAATTDIALAHEAYRPDFSVQGSYGYRRAFGNFIGVQLSIDLPYFTRNRQDRELTAALQQSVASEARKQDVLRELQSRISEDYADWQHDLARGADFDRAIVPDAVHRVEAARSAYESGRGSFDAVLLARRSVLDVQLQRLAVTTDAARARIRLRYYATVDDHSGVVP